MPWYFWAAIIWTAVALPVGILIGKSIRQADVKEVGRVQESLGVSP